MCRRLPMAMCLLVPVSLALVVSTSLTASAKAPKAKAPAKTSPKKKPPKSSASTTTPATGSTVKLAITSSGYMKTDLVISAPPGTTAKKLVDSPDTLVTFPDGSQMVVVPDAASLSDYRKGLTTGSDKVTFLVDAVDHFTFLDKAYSEIPGGISFFAKKDLPALVENKALATGLLCTNHGTSDTKQTSSEATINAMIASCLSAASA